MIKKCLICDKEYSGQKNDKQVCPECLWEISKEFMSHKEIVIKEIKNKYWDNFINGTLVINCETKQEAKKLCEHLHKKGFKWIYHRDLKDDTRWNLYKRDTCYINYSDGIQYCSIDFYKDNHQIIKYKDIFD